MSYLFLDSREVKARKPHWCDWCGERILEQTKYVKNVGIFERDFCQTKFHPECDKASSIYFSDDDFEDGDSYEPYTFVRGTTKLKGEQ